MPFKHCTYCKLDIEIESLKKGLRNHIQNTHPDEWLVMQKQQDSVAGVRSARTPRDQKSALDTPLVGAPGWTKKVDWSAAVKSSSLVDLPISRIIIFRTMEKCMRWDESPSNGVKFGQRFVCPCHLNIPGNYIQPGMDFSVVHTNVYPYIAEHAQKCPAFKKLALEC